jgi:hypothetical protein
MEQFYEIGYVTAGFVIAGIVQKFKDAGVLSGLWLLGLAWLLSELFSVPFEIYQGGTLSFGTLFRGIFLGFALAFTTAKSVDLLKARARDVAAGDQDLMNPPPASPVETFVETGPDLPKNETQS